MRSPPGSRYRPETEPPDGARQRRPDMPSITAARKYSIPPSGASGGSQAESYSRHRRGQRKRNVAARSPNVARNWGWQYIFPQRMDQVQADLPDRSQSKLIHHVDPQTLHRKFERAALDASIYRRVTGHVLRNSFALHMIQRGLSVSRVERILGSRAGQSSTLDDEEASSLPLPADDAGSRVSFH